MRISSRGTLLLYLGGALALSTGCPDDDDGTVTPIGDVLVDAGGDATLGDVTGDGLIADAGADVVGDVAEDAAPGDAGADAAADAGPDAADTVGDAGDVIQPPTTTFSIRIDNTSDRSALPSGLSPGVWALADENPLFVGGAVDQGSGLEALAEDGDPSALAATLAGELETRTGTFEIPVDATSAGPAMPGGAFELTVEASPDDGQLFIVSMYGESNDTFLATIGIDLFDDQGAPVAANVSDTFALWNAGTEQDQAPTMGPDQAPRQAAPDTGAAEGVVRRFSDTTRAIPAPAALLQVTAEDAGTSDDGNRQVAITIRNVSEDVGTLMTPLSPVFWAMHDTSYGLFRVGDDASDALERLAEDGDPQPLAEEARTVAAIGASGVVDEPDEAPGAAMPIGFGQSYTFTVEVTQDHPMLSFATMVGESNDAFVATPAEGVSFFAGDGSALTPQQIQDALARQLAVWDAGTEANEVVGVGPNQAPRQHAPDTGPIDEDAGVRRYADATNDLDGEAAGGFAAVTIENGEEAGTFVLTVTNTSDGTAYPGMLSPTLWALFGDDLSLFETGAAADEGLERLAEDGDASVWAGALVDTGLAESGVLETAMGAAGPGPLAPGESYTATLTVSPERPNLSIASMIAPSNDTFLSLGPVGIALLDEAGAPRTDADIAADVAVALGAYDAGTESNQASALGADMTPHQAAPDTGAPEGDGTIRLEAFGAVWAFPLATEIVRVTVTPQ